MSKLITADCDWIQGYLRYGHWELTLEDDEYEKFKSLSEKEQIEWIEDAGNLEVDSYEINDCANATNIQVI